MNLSNQYVTHLANHLWIKTWDRDGTIIWNQIDYDVRLLFRTSILNTFQHLLKVIGKI